MTILVCQKRHHEPHLTWDTPARFGGWQVCDGLPRWPHPRPKPPCVQDWDAYCTYMSDHGTMTVVSTGDWWLVEWEGPESRYQAVSFLKNEWPAAINYAQKLAQERSNNSGSY